MSTIVIGPNRAVTDPRQLNWGVFPKGQVIQLEGKGTPYNTKILISTDDFTLEGVQGPGKDYPVIDGSTVFEPTTNDYLHGWYVDKNKVEQPGQGGQSLVFIGCSKSRGYGVPPNNVKMIGHGTLQNYFYDPANPQKYIDEKGKVWPIGVNAMGIHIQQAHGCLIQGWDVIGCNNGFTTTGNCAAELGTDYTFDGMLIDKFGTTKNGALVGQSDRRDRDHGSYVSALRVTYRNMKYGSPKPGSFGAALKDRAAGTDIQFCEIGLIGNCNAARLLDLVDPEEGRGCLDVAPEFQLTKVWNNILRSTGGAYPVHGGSDGKGDPRPLIHLKNNQHFYQMNQRPFKLPDGSIESGNFRLELVKLDHGPTKIILEDEIITLIPGSSGVVPDPSLVYSETLDPNSNIEIRGSLKFTSPKPFQPSRSNTPVLNANLIQYTLYKPSGGSTAPSVPPVIVPPTTGGTGGNTTVPDPIKPTPPPTAPPVVTTPPATTPQYATQTQVDGLLNQINVLTSQLATLQASFQKLLDGLKTLGG